MNLKLLAILTIAISLVLFCFAVIYKVPVAYVPQDASLAEYVIYHMVFVVTEAFILSALFIHMLMKSKLEFNSNLTRMFG